MKPIIDRFLKLTISKKLTVFIVGCLFAVNEIITGTEWVYLSLVYIGTQGAIDLYNNIKK